MSTRSLKMKVSLLAILVSGAGSRSAYSESAAAKAKKPSAVEEKALVVPSDQVMKTKMAPKSDVKDAAEPESIVGSEQQKDGVIATGQGVPDGHVGRVDSEDPYNNRAGAAKVAEPEEVLYGPNSAFEVAARKELDFSGDDTDLESVDGVSGEVRERKKVCLGAKSCPDIHSQATLEVTSNVSNATIMLDDLIVGEVGDTVDVKPGANALRVAAPGFPEKKLTVRAKKGEHIKIHVELGKGH